MSDGSLSQDEIDALLSGGGAEPEVAAAVGAADVPGLSPQENQALTDVLGGLTESQATNLSSMVGKTVTIGQPTLEVISNGTFVSSLPEQVVQIKLNFTGVIAGDHSLLFSPEIALTVAGMMMGQEDVELNEAALSALEEAGNTLAGAEATALSDFLGIDVSTEPGESRSIAADNVEVPEGEFVKAVYPVTIEGQEAAELTELFAMPMAKQIAGGGASSEPEPVVSAGTESDADPFSMAGLGGEGDGLDMAFGGQSMGGLGQPNVQAVQFPSLSDGAAPGEQGNIGLLMDVHMEMTVELGRTKKLIRDILGMGEGTIIELDKLAGEPVDILVNHKLIAKGEVVVIDENFGVRVTEIVDPMDRVTEM